MMNNLSLIAIGLAKSVLAGQLRFSFWPASYHENFHQESNIFEHDLFLVDIGVRQ